jgi:hypothetical protein
MQQMHLLCYLSHLLFGVDLSAIGPFYLLHLLHEGAKHRDGPRQQRGLKLVVEGRKGVVIKLNVIF